jgi:thiol-disulfide isomerase/thioredoxin
MRKFISTAFICFLAVLETGAQSYKITLESNYRSGIAYLTYHMGSKYNVEDSAAVSNKGIAVFTGNKVLPGGIYAIVFPGQRLTADFLMGKEQVISIKADTNNLGRMQVIGSKENILFQEYQQYVAVKGRQLMQERQSYMASANAKDSALHEGNYTRFNTELNDYRSNIITKSPTSLMAVLLTAMKDPPYPAKVPVTRQDSLDNYNYYKSHYWDGISFMDDRVIRTPFFLPKLERYYREVIGQSAPDSIIKDIDYKMLLARTNPNMYKFLLNWFTDEYLNPKYMGQDAIFVHLFQKYHSKGLSPWLNEKQMETISRRAYMQMENLIGVQAANLEMLDTAGKPKALYDVNADYTLVIFWDPTCGHCKEELPRIDSIYRASWEKRGLRIFAVLTEDQKGEWIKYINTHNLRDWVNVYQTKEMADALYTAQKPGYKQLYDVIQTPTLVLLDKEKRIIGKKLSWQQLNDFLESKWNKTAR